VEYPAAVALITMFFEWYYGSWVRRDGIGLRIGDGEWGWGWGLWMGMGVVEYRMGIHIYLTLYSLRGGIGYLPVRDE